MIQAAAYVGLYEDVDSLLLEGASQCVKALVRTPLGAVAIASRWREMRIGSNFQS
jgi:hypothetical protein